MAGLVVSYGCTGIGKTLDICRCFRGGLVLLTDRDGLRAVQTLEGRTPRHVLLADRTSPLAEIDNVVQRTVAPLIQQKKLRAVILSTASELAERMLGEALGQHKDPRQAFQAVHADFMRLTEDLINLGVWVVYECQEAQPFEEDYRVRPGGPQFPGRRLMEGVCYRASMVLRARYNSLGDRTYQCVKNDVMWTMKDRYNVCDAEQALDLLTLMKKTAENSAQPH